MLQSRLMLRSEERTATFWVRAPSAWALIRKESQQLAGYSMSIRARELSKSDAPSFAQRLLLEARNECDSPLLRYFFTLPLLLISDIAALSAVSDTWHPGLSAATVEAACSPMLATGGHAPPLESVPW
jgi:hypothetical protein